jgi:TRAP-type C4-dicarboxylate transport system substrate-binding protein
MQGGIPMTMAGLATDFDERLNVGYLAYVVDNWESARRLYGPGGPMVGILDGVLADLNLKLIGTIPGGFGSIAVRKGVDARPTSFPDEAAGFKMRTPPFEIGVRRFEAWGFAAVPIPYSELYTALQLGTVDGRSFGPPQEIWEMRDTLGAYILTRDYFDVAFWVANKDWWNGLSAEQRGWIEAAAADAVALGWEEGERREVAELQKIKDFGIEVVELTPDELAKAKAIIYETEWPWMTSIVGDELMKQVREAAGVK